MQNYSDHIGIVGGGIGGLTLGCALLKEGIPAVIFEKSSKEASHGAALSLSQNALCLLDRLDIYNDLKDQSFVHSKASIFGPQKLISTFKTPELLTTHRQTLISLLYERYLSLGGEIFYDHAFKDFDPINCEVVFENNERYVFNHLAGCDGIRSSIRDTFFSPAQEPKYSGYSAWRGIGKSNLKSVHFALGSDSHIVRYPINHEGDVSFVAVKKEEYQFKESWKEEGSYKNLLDDFSYYDSSIFPELEDSKPLYKWGIYIRPPLKSMVFENITLLGDAAHPMVPFLGQGACMAIEDAYSLAILYKKNNRNILNTQQAYSYFRNKRTQRIQKISMRQGKIYHIKKPLFVAARNAVMKYTNFPGNNLKKIHGYNAYDDISAHYPDI